MRASCSCSEGRVQGRSLLSDCGCGSGQGELRLLSRPAGTRPWASMGFRMQGRAVGLLGTSGGSGTSLKKLQEREAGAVPLIRGRGRGIRGFS